MGERGEERYIFLLKAHDPSLAVHVDLLEELHQVGDLVLEGLLLGFLFVDGFLELPIYSLVFSIN